MEFTRTTGGPLAAAGQPTAADTPERTLSFGTVTHASEGAKNAANVAELLLFRGLATVSKHRSCALDSSFTLVHRLCCVNAAILVAVGELPLAAAESDPSAQHIELDGLPHMTPCRREPARPLLLAIRL